MYGENNTNEGDEAEYESIEEKHFMEAYYSSMIPL